MTDWNALSSNDKGLLVAFIKKNMAAAGTDPNTVADEVKMTTNGDTVTIPASAFH